MKVLENKIIEDVRHIILKEKLRHLKKEDKIHDFFQNKLNIFSFFKEQFKMHEVTKKYIETFEKVLNRISEKDFTEENLEDLRKAFLKKEEMLKDFYTHDILGRELIINENGILQIKDKFEQLSFSLYEYMIKQYNELENKTEEEKKELLLKTSLIHNYLRDYSFAATADATAKLKLACRDGKEGWKKML
jgi:hypothetical protein